MASFFNMKIIPNTLQVQYKDTWVEKHKRRISVMDQTPQSTDLNMNIIYWSFWRRIEQKAVIIQRWALNVLQRKKERENNDLKAF